MVHVFRLSVYEAQQRDKGNIVRYRRRNHGTKMTKSDEKQMKFESYAISLQALNEMLGENGTHRWARCRELANGGPG